MWQASGQALMFNDAGCRGPGCTKPGAGRRYHPGCRHHDDRAVFADSVTVGPGLTVDSVSTVTQI
eukprot:530685-Hanusia_phi.AAC.1